MTTAVLIVAAGQGRRAGGPLPKQYAAIGGIPVVRRTLATFLSHGAVDLIQPVIATGDGDLFRMAIQGLDNPKLSAAVSGGATRQASVQAGLLALAPRAPDRVLIHDAVRPFVTTGIISRVLEALADSPGAIAAVALADTLKQAGTDLRIKGTVDRAGLWRAQTPQGFHFAAILDAHARAAVADFEGSDDAAIAEWAGLPVALVPDSPGNSKITTPEDLAMAEQRLRGHSDVRTGSGFDVHRLIPGDHVWLGGVRISHDQGLQGHSDADVALHALTDALLGTIGDGDIGQHFPDSDPRWKGAASHIFLAEAARRVRAAGGLITNVDVTLLCEAPRIGPHRQAMQARIAAILGIETGRVGVKATTTEGLGFIGRGEGIAALASATVVIDPLQADPSA